MEKLASRRFLRKNIYIVIVLVLMVCLIIPGVPKTAFAAQNPSPEEISGIFDQVAKEKQVPAEILKAIAYHESGWRQWDSKGNVVANYASPKPYLGIMQVGAYNASDTAVVSKLKSDIAFNIAYGADVLISKWEMTPRIGDGDRSKLENWYFAIWAYNSWSTRNNPNNAAAAGKTAYQDAILRLMGMDYMKGVVSPVLITPVPNTLIPAGTLPSKNADWKTPEPVHYAGFASPVPGLSQEEQNTLLASVPRIAGTDRIDTAIKIAGQGWPNGCETVIIARSDDFPDALAGVALAKQKNAPILLTSQDSLDSRVEAALLRLKPLKVIILGGNNAISDVAEKKLKEDLSWTQDFERIAGQDRFETAALIARRFPIDQGVAITTGDNFPDALSLAAASASKGYPLLLAGKEGLSSSTENALRTLCPRQVYIAGGEEVISPGLLDHIKEIAGLPEDQIKRFSGADRYETSSLIVQAFFPQTGKIFAATGQTFPDALAGAALAANQKIPMLLVSPEGPAAGSSTEQYLQSLTDQVNLQVFGGKEAVSDLSIIRLRYLLNN
ncbi:MAG: N-acetylmuramoyl-L-alanine amidase LytC [Candidatus Dichloromethanomonas elyunquensis]|nr:MAG: N-acetylmuramoyl-L-alanine amidase LytC [Candidatus Dichloromethanomonas elyunquensis]